MTPFYGTWLWQYIIAVNLQAANLRYLLHTSWNKDLCNKYEQSNQRNCHCHCKQFSFLYGQVKYFPRKTAGKCDNSFISIHVVHSIWKLRGHQLHSYLQDVQMENEITYETKAQPHRGAVNFTFRDMHFALHLPILSAISGDRWKRKHKNGEK